MGARHHDSICQTRTLPRQEPDRTARSHSWLNGAGIAGAQREALGLAGIGSAIFVMVALASAFVISLPAGWMRIAVRVAGSWVAAIGLLMLGWSVRGSV